MISSPLSKISLTVLNSIKKRGEWSETNNRPYPFYSNGNSGFNCCGYQRNYVSYYSRSFRRIDSVICNINNDKPFSSKAMMLPMQSQITRPILFLRNCQIKRSPALAYLKTCIDKHRRPSDIFWHEAFSR